ncbi:MAG TPA: HAMP domain-containing sensor histidine kinase, partial [Methanoregula sp.]|nr:HAMP domain-containing sensor histidine kinase [Methanoregula sp.]
AASMVFILSAFLVVGIVSVIVSELLLRRYIIRDLTGLDATMKDIGGRRDLSKRIPVSGDDEIASLKQSLNGMLQELEEKEERLAEAHRKANMYLDIYLDVLTYEILNAAIAHRAYAELLLESEGDDKNKFVSRIVGLIDRNREVIKNIETISAIYKNPPSRQPTDLAALLRRVTGDDYPGEAIRCEGCGISVLADEKLEIVFKNIINNSIRYGGKDVQITITVKETANGKAEIAVEDTGKGIPDAMKPQIFDRFTKGTDTRSSYGLGLHIVKMLIEAYGGRVWADDRVAGHPEEGAAIRFTLFIA